MGQVFLYLFIFVVFILLIYVEFKRYRIRIDHLEKEKENSMSTIDNYDAQEDPSVLVDVHKERLYRLKKKELQADINREYQNRDQSSNQTPLED